MESYSISFSIFSYLFHKPRASGNVRAVSVCESLRTIQAACIHSTAPKLRAHWALAHTAELEHTLQHPHTEHDGATLLSFQFIILVPHYNTSLHGSYIGSYSVATQYYLTYNYCNVCVMHNFLDFMNSQIELSEMKNLEIILQTYLSLLCKCTINACKENLCILISNRSHTLQCTYLPM